MRRRRRAGEGLGRAGRRMASGGRRRRGSGLTPPLRDPSAWRGARAPAVSTRAPGAQRLGYDLAKGEHRGDGDDDGRGGVQQPVQEDGQRLHAQRVAQQQRDQQQVLVGDDGHDARRVAPLRRRACVGRFGLRGRAGVSEPAPAARKQAAGRPPIAAGRAAAAAGCAEARGRPPTRRRPSRAPPWPRPLGRAARRLRPLPQLLPLSHRSASAPPAPPCPATSGPASGRSSGRPPAPAGRRRR